MLGWGRPSQRWGADRVPGATCTVLAAIALVALSACADEETSVPALEGQGAGGEGGSAGSLPVACGPGQIEGHDGECLAVGIQGCAAMFIEDDNLCHPSMDKCPAGTIPKFDEGCVPVGIQGCPEVFMEDDGLCHPSMDKCPADTFAAPLLGCVPIDGEQGCGTGTWGHIADGPDTVWVDPGYAGGDGDGSKVKPLGTIADALAIVVDGGRVALAAGDYDEPVHITMALELVGRCPSMVTISGTLAIPEWIVPAVVVIENTDGVLLRNLRLSGEGQGVAALGATASLEGIHLEQTTSAAILAIDDAELAITRCLVEDTLTSVETGLGHGLLLFDGATTAVRDSAVVANRDAGIVALGSDDNGELRAMELSIDGSLVEGSLDVGAGEQGVGVFSYGAAAVSVSSSAFVRNQHAGVMAYHHGAIALETSLVDETLPRLDGRMGHGVILYDSASATLDSNALVDNRRTAIEANDQSSVEAHGNLLRDTVDELKWPGAGCFVRAGSSLSLVDNAVVGSEGAGVVVHEAVDLVVDGNLIERNGRPDDGPTMLQANGLGVVSSELAVLSSNALVGNLGLGLKIGASTAVVRDNLIERSERTDTSWWRRGQGVYVEGVGTTASLEGNAVLHNAAAGLWVLGGAAVDVERLLVADTGPHVPDGEYGVGIHVVGTSTVELDRVVAIRNHLAAVLVQGSTVSLSNSLLRSTAAGSFTVLACPAQPCPWNMQQTHHGIADGLIAVSSDVSLAGVQVDGCGRAGVVYHASRGELTDLCSVDNGFGLVLQSTPRPTVGEGCSFDPNSEQSVLEDSEIAVPNEGSELPEGAGR